MCGRFFLADSDNSGELRSIIDQLNRRGAIVKTGEIFPTDTVPVLANNRNRRVMPFSMQWGYTLPDDRLLINARSETAGEKALFQDAMRQHRCLIPATNYFEWEKRGREKIKPDRNLRHYAAMLSTKHSLRKTLHFHTPAPKFALHRSPDSANPALHCLSE